MCAGSLHSRCTLSHGKMYKRFRSCTVRGTLRIRAPSVHLLFDTKSLATSSWHVTIDDLGMRPIDAVSVYIDNRESLRYQAFRPAVKTPPPTSPLNIE